MKWSLRGRHARCFSNFIGHRLSSLDATRVRVGVGFGTYVRCGLIGRRLKQGECREPELDKACFCSPIGQVDGPIRTGEGYHLVLVEERLGLERYDEGMTRVVARPNEAGDGGVRSVLAPPDPDEVNELLDPGAILNLILSGLAVTVGGQVIANVASSIDLEKIANSVN